MGEAFKTSGQMLILSGSGYSLSKTDIGFAVEMACLITPVILSVLMFIRNSKKNNKGNDSNGK